jgi:cation diffusion facilitator CzcD-associated flavoprotein CzcO
MVSDSMPLQSKKVCVIGAGMAGLAAAQELRREGHNVTVLEQSGDIGGQWLRRRARRRRAGESAQQHLRVAPAH